METGCGTVFLIFDSPPVTSKRFPLQAFALPAPKASPCCLNGRPIETNTGLAMARRSIRHGRLCDVAHIRPARTPLMAPHRFSKAISKDLFKKFGVDGMSPIGNDRSERLLPAAITALIALIGTIGYVVMAFANEPEKHSHGTITVMAVMRAGATITPSELR
jgi:hypothetical protein